MKRCLVVMQSQFWRHLFAISDNVKDHSKVCLCSQMNTLLGVFVTVIVTAFICNVLQHNETVTTNKDLRFFVIATVPASVSNFPLYQGLNIISCLAFKELLGFAFSSFSRYSHVLLDVW